MIVGFTYEEIAEILDGYFYNKLEQPSPIIDFEFDPTRLTDNGIGNCFISISRERWNQFHRKNLPWIDGNERILKYYKNCDLIITEQPIQELEQLVTQIIVKNSFKAIRILAKNARDKMNHPVIGITGSVGKSSTRLALEHLLKNEHTMVATRGNHNTQAGVPLYGAKLCRNPEIAILEISLNALNNRGNQSVTIRPNVGIVTSIGEAHLSTLHSTVNVAKFKARIFDGLEQNGLAIINKDMGKEEFNILYERAKKRTNRIKTYSLVDETADLFLKKRVHKKYKTMIIFQYKNKEYAFDMKMPSDGTIINALGAFLCLAELGYDIHSMLTKMYHFKSLDRVMELKQLHTSDHRGIDIIDDSHNAAVPSMLNAIKTFKEKQVFYKGRKILVLGQIADLGNQTADLHNQLVPHILKSGADYVFGHGEHMRAVIRQLPTEMVGGWFDNAQDISSRIPYYCSDDSLIILKGSVSGSDFRHISYLLPNRLKRSRIELKHPTPKLLVNVLQPRWGLVGYDLNKNIKVFEKGYINTKAIEGISPLILLILLFEKGIQYEKVNRLNSWPTNRGVSIHQKPFKTGQSFTHRELVEELIQRQHPSVIFELAYLYFGSRTNAMFEITKMTHSLGVSSSATLNLTGRYRVKEQQSFTIDDLIKISKKMNQYQSQLPVFMQLNGINVRGIEFGSLRSHCIIFVKNIVCCVSGMENKPNKQDIIQTLTSYFKSVEMTV
ncbi:MAG TPA: UDP-N-acetylmuramoyl-tripeptide--D-alanyl-D-alanine ligase [Bacillota bacterium]|nr:UDP-N-acetylmuramoyl-tripeptide--D-alanyl-D-alanine ligase [Bacillota bacterium]